MIVPEVVQKLIGLCEKASPPAGAQWLAAAAARLGQPASESSRAEFLGLFAAAGRKMGTRLLQVPSGSLDEVVHLAVNMRGLDEVARVALLVAETARSSDMQSLVTELYVRGSEREKQAVLRALPLLPQQEKLVLLATEACRSSAQTVFEAICCDSAFPARMLPEPAFNQMVLKALFTGASLLRVEGLGGRVTHELVRMARGYGEERRAAGRPVPLDLEHLLSFTPSGPAPEAAGPSEPAALPTTGSWSD
jgi:hypothetical protein